MPNAQSAHSRPAAPGAWSDSELLRLRDGTTVLLRSIDLGALRAVPEDDFAGVAAEDPEGRTVGWATYARAYGPRAEVGLTVDPLFWHRGLPELLLAGLSVHAARVGISTFFIAARASDLSLLAMLRTGFCSRETIEGASVHVEFPTTRQPVTQPSHGTAAAADHGRGA
jgi:GNAT superfamily N-acetyltransferase